MPKRINKNVRTNLRPIQEQVKISSSTSSMMERELDRENSRKIMDHVKEYQNMIGQRLGSLVNPDEPVDYGIEGHKIQQLWKCRRSQLNNVYRQCMQLQKQIAYTLMMTTSIEEWLAETGKEVLAGDYDLAMINADLGSAYDILSATEKNLNHNYTSKFNGWGVLNSTLVPEQ